MTNTNELNAAISKLKHETWDAAAWTVVREALNCGDEHAIWVIACTVSTFRPDSKEATMEIVKALSVALKRTTDWTSQKALQTARDAFTRAYVAWGR